MIPSEIVLLVIVSYVDITCSAMVECVCVADSCKWKLRRQRPQRGNVNGDLAGEAQKGCALDVLAQVYKLVYLCVLCVFAQIDLGEACKFTCLSVVQIW